MTTTADPLVPPLTCSVCGGETFIQWTPEQGERGPFHVDTLSRADEHCKRHA